MDTTREQALVARSRVDASAFGELYDFYLPRIYGFLARRVGERAVAEDLTAMTFERALSVIRRGDFRNESFGGWLYRVASNALVDHLRRGRWTVTLVDRRADADETDRAIELVGDEAATAAFVVVFDCDVLRCVLRCLPEAQRRILVLK